MASTPRSILKARRAQCPLPPPPPPSSFSIPQSNFSPSVFPFSYVGSPHVHFPPTPGLVSGTGSVYSPTTYDRAPIAVSPNSYALPPRDVVGSYFHPRAREVCQLESDRGSRAPEQAVPDLIPDVSSPSSSSDDGMLSPIPSTPAIPRFRENNKDDYSFLPHPPSSPKPKKKKMKTTRRSSLFVESSSSEGCLGGF